MYKKVYLKDSYRNILISMTKKIIKIA